MTPQANDDAVLCPGTSVEVANAFLGTWAGGFEVVDSGEWGYRVRRASDAAVLPVSFAPNRVRARSRSRYA